MSQLAAHHASHPMWVRLFAFAGLLVIWLASSAQAAHIHGDWLPHHEVQCSAQADSAAGAGDETSCPLCIAMHSAMTVSSGSQPAPIIAVTLIARPAVTRSILRALHYSLFSRPPPSIALVFSV